MAYYRGDYYMGGYRGDYYRGRGAGDPFWGALWTGIKTVGGALLGTLRTGAAAQQQQAQIAGGLSGVQSAQSPYYMQMPSVGVLSAERQPIGRIGTIAEQRARIGGRTDPATGLPMKRRHMNPANAKALRRSIRRVVGFGRLAMRSRRAVGKAATALQCHRSSSRRSFPARKR